MENRSTDPPPEMHSSAPRVEVSLWRGNLINRYGAHARNHHARGAVLFKPGFISVRNNLGWKKSGDRARPETKRERKKKYPLLLFPATVIRLRRKIRVKGTDEGGRLRKGRSREVSSSERTHRGPRSFSLAMTWLS